VRLRFRDGWAARPWLADAGVSASLLGLFVLQVVAGSAPEPGQRPTDVLAVGLTAAMIGPYLIHRRAPLIAAAITLTALLASSAAHVQTYPGINAFVLLFGITLHTADQRRRITVFAATLIALSVAVWLQPDGVATTSTWVSTLLVAIVCGLGGDNLRHRRARWAALEERARFIEFEREERTRSAVIDERLRIARELHDVVAHSMSVIAVQAGVGRHVLDTQPEEARHALAAIETTSRSALNEMRRLLGVLRQEGQPRAALSPTPGLADLPALLAQVREAGLGVTSIVTGQASAVALPLDLTAYRIIQEALTNALKHGGPAATVTIDYRPEEVRLEVTDDGPTRKPVRDPHQVRDPHHDDAVGHGLIGMRERVAVFGGQLSTGSRPGGGFRVAARLPMAQDPT
jgi:signal transduction histidine kinase